MSTGSELVYNKVRDMFLEAGVQATVITDGFQVPYGTTVVNVIIVAQDDRTLIQMYAPVLHHLPASPELFEYIAIDGQSFYFGSMRYTPDIADGLLSFEHTLLGDYLDADELHSAVGALATTADEVDEDLQRRFGGKRFID